MKYFAKWRLELNSNFVLGHLGAESKWNFRGYLKSFLSAKLVNFQKVSRSFTLLNKYFPSLYFGPF